LLIGTQYFYRKILADFFNNIGSISDIWGRAFFDIVGSPIADTEPQARRHGAADYVMEMRGGEIVQTANDRRAAGGSGDDRDPHPDCVGRIAGPIPCRICDLLLAETMIGRAEIFENRATPGDWRVEREDEDGSIEVAIFSGPNARQRALRYADHQYGDFAEVSTPYPGPQHAAARPAGAAMTGKETMARRLQLIACVAAALSAFLAVIGLGDVPADVNVLGTVHR
jgi:hypothetical protein